MEYTALILFTIATSITPGPNNVMIMTSGMNHGFRKSIPHLAGIDLGFPLMLIAIGLGITELFNAFPTSFIVMKVVGVFYLSYLAVKIATMPVQSFDHVKAKPLSFIQAALFQWVNPKAWIMCIGALVTYASVGEGYFQQVLLIALIFFLFGAPCTIAWLSFGSSLKQVLSKPAYLKAFNVSMAALLIASLLPVLQELYELSIN
jgi:threonine/homoserine/homoserine lactone efflux protein